MQSAKDTFYVALRDRLAALNPERTIFLNGVTRPAALVVENEHITSAGPPPQAFCIRWGEARPAETMARAPRPLLALECAISYWTAGTAENQGVDRGRLLAALDAELLQICSPHHAPKRDYAQTPEVDLGTEVLWSVPQLRLRSAAPRLAADATEWQLTAGELLTTTPGPGNPPARLERIAALTVFFYPEGGF